jgi:hypothetical protein
VGVREINRRRVVVKGKMFSGKEEEKKKRNKDRSSYKTRGEKGF